MSRQVMRWVSGIAVGLCCVSCGSGSSGGNRERSTYLMVSSTLGYTAPAAHGVGTRQGSLTSAQGLAPCNVADTTGSCLTPSAASGKVVNLSLGHTVAELGGMQGTPGVRLYGSGEGLDRDGRLTLAPFDLKNPQMIPGEGTLQEAAVGSAFTQLDTLFGYIEVQLALEQRFWTVRFLFYPQPLENDETIKACVDSHRLDAIAQNGAVIAGSPAFERGDVMYCAKDTVDEACAPSDFKWLDTASHAFVSERPTAPRRLAFIVEHGIECLLYAEGPTDANHGQPGVLHFNGFHMGSLLTTPLPVWAEFDACNKKFHTRLADGSIDNGTSLAAVLNYDLEHFVFFPGVSDLTAASDLDLLSVVTLVPIYAREKLGEGPAAGQYSHVTASVTLGHDPVPACTGGAPDPGSKM
jgi:hypothetical protein